MEFWWCVKSCEAPPFLPGGEHSNAKLPFLQCTTKTCFFDKSHWCEPDLARVDARSKERGKKKNKSFCLLGMQKVVKVVIPTELVL